MAINQVRKTASAHTKKDAEHAAAMATCAELVARGILLQPVGRAGSSGEAQQHADNFLSSLATGPPEVDVIELSLATARRQPLCLSISASLLAEPSSIGGGEGQEKVQGQEVCRPLEWVEPGRDGPMGMTAAFPADITHVLPTVPASHWAGVPSMPGDAGLAAAALRATQVVCVEPCRATGGAEMMAALCADWGSNGVGGSLSVLHCSHTDAEVAALAINLVDRVGSGGCTVGRHSASDIPQPHSVGKNKVLCSTYAATLQRLRHDPYLTTTSVVVLGGLGQCSGLPPAATFMLTMLRALVRRRVRHPQFSLESLYGSSRLQNNRKLRGPQPGLRVVLLGDGGIGQMSSIELAGFFEARPSEQSPEGLNLPSTKTVALEDLEDVQSSRMIKYTPAVVAGWRTVCCSHPCGTRAFRCLSCAQIAVAIAGVGG